MKIKFETLEGFDEEAVRVVSLGCIFHFKKYTLEVDKYNVTVTVSNKDYFNDVQEVLGTDYNRKDLSKLDFYNEIIDNYSKTFENVIIDEEEI